MKKDDANKTEVELLEGFEKWAAEFHKREKYTELNPEIIRSISDEHLAQAIRDFAALAINEDWKNQTSKVPALGPGFSAVYFMRFGLRGEQRWVQPVLLQ